MTEPLTMKARIQAPLKAVHHALTDPGELRTWFAEHAEVDLPHRFEFWGRYTPDGDAPHQRLLHADDHTLRFAWLLDGEDTTSEITLTEEGADSTLLAVSQTHWEFPGPGSVVCCTPSGHWRSRTSPITSRVVHSPDWSTSRHRSCVPRCSSKPPARSCTTRSSTRRRSPSGSASRSRSTS